MKRILLTLTLALSCFGQSQNNTDPNRIIIPYGDWIYCEGPNAAIGVPGLPLDCSTFKAGNEQYLLLIKAVDPAAQIFTYTVAGVRKDGQTITVTGAVARNDSPQGFTQVLITFGAPIEKWSVSVREFDESK
jgi:hypothetical protein